MATKNWSRHDFDSRAALAQALATTVASQLREAITIKDAALLAVSGGTTPAGFFKALSDVELDWQKVVITLIDERFVPDGSPRSNAGLVKTKLLQNKAKLARFIPLAAPSDDIDAARNAAEAGLRLFGLPLDVAVLGMGNDGHTASFFPDAEQLEQLLDPAATEAIAEVTAESAGEPRLTMTLPIIASARFIALQIEGAEKEAALKKALKPGSRLPIRRVIDAAQAPVEIFWAA